MELLLSRADRGRSKRHISAVYLTRQMQPLAPGSLRHKGFRAPDLNLGI